MEVKALTPGSVLNSTEKQYTIVRQLHNGGFGITYLAKGTFMDGNIPQEGTYAIKEFYISKYCTRLENGSVTAENVKDKMLFETAKNDFRTEARILNKLKHKGIVPVNEVFDANNTVYYVMKYLGGTTLERYVCDNGGRLDEAESKRIVKEMIDAVTYLHKNEILHLDLKPNNVMMCGIGTNLHAVLIDFGQAKYFKNGKLASKNVIGGYTRGYSAPELKNNMTVFSPQSDVYSLAATMTYMLTGVDPEDSETITRKKIYGMLPDDVSDNCMNGIVAAMCADMAKRTPTAEAFMRHLETGQGGGGGGSTTDPVVNTKWYEKKFLKYAACAAIIVAIVCMWPKKHEQEPKPKPHDTITNKVDSVKANPTKTVQPAQRQPAQQQPAQQQPVQQQSTQQQPEPQKVDVVVKKGRVELGYATWNGEIRNGKPHGYGTMSYHEQREVQGRAIEAGQRIEGEYLDGNFVSGTIYSGGTVIDIL